MILDKDGKAFPSTETWDINPCYSWKAKWVIDNVLKTNPLLKLLEQNIKANAVREVAEEIHGSPLPRPEETKTIRFRTYNDLQQGEEK